MRRDYLLLAGLAAFFFIPFLGHVHLFDWDEINFAECAREMLRTGDYSRPQIDYEPFWEKPPLFLWMQALAMHLFGVNEFAARFPNAVCGILTVLVVYRIGLRVFDRTFAWLWALAWVGTILPHLYFRSGIIDPWFNLLIFLGLYGFIEFRWVFFTNKYAVRFWPKYGALLLGGLALGLAILTKGPTAYLIVFLVLIVYFARYRFKNKGFLQHLAFFSLAAASVSLLWFGIEWALHGPFFIQEFLRYQVRLFSTPDAGHGGFMGYHVVVLLLGCFPASVFALPNLWGDHSPEDELLESDPLAECKRSDLTTWMQILFWVVLILFSLVRTKIVHYSSLCYFPLTYLGVLTIWRAMWWDIQPRIVAFVLPVVGSVVAAAALALPWLGQHIEVLQPFFARDPFAMANLEARITWHWWESAPGAVLLLATWAAWVYWLRGRAWEAAQLAFGGSALFVAFALLFFVPNIEGYSQCAAVEFYESKSGEDCYVRPVGYKSYAHLFYTDKPPVQPDHTVDDFDNLAYGKPGKKVYFVAKITNLAELPRLEGCRELYRKNGFVFFVREAGK
jgi:4-amino-4-deoxy-L-arabinose transferase-like glycosyltransferase